MPQCVPVPDEKIKSAVESKDADLMFNALLEKLRDQSLTENDLDFVFAKGRNSNALYAKLHQSGGNACGKVMKGGELAYNCRTCQYDDTCIICADCFKNSNHKGHDVRMTFAYGGCCDCG